jgi:hypothetical protein
MKMQKKVIVLIGLAFSGECVVRSASEDGLRSRRKFQSIQNPQLGESPDIRSIVG